ncbi:DNA methylase, partial [Escherichia coli EC1865]
MWAIATNAPTSWQ